MLIISYDRDETFLQRVPFTVEIDPVLVELDRLLDDPKLVLTASNALLHSAPEAAWTGRPSTPVVVSLRQAVLRRLMNWSYRTLETELKGNVIWRWFCRIDEHRVPDHSTTQTRERLMRPATVRRLHARVVQGAVDHKVTHGRKLRTDGTVIETAIHHPSDSHLLSDSVRVLGRLLERARLIIKPHSHVQKQCFRNSTRRAKRLAYRIAQRLRGSAGKKSHKHRPFSPIGNCCT